MHINYRGCNEDVCESMETQVGNRQGTSDNKYQITNDRWPAQRNH